MILSGAAFVYTLYILIMFYSKYGNLLTTDRNLLGFIIRIILSLIIYIFAYRENANQRLLWVFKLDYIKIKYTQASTSL